MHRKIHFSGAGITEPTAQPPNLECQNMAGLKQEVARIRQLPKRKTDGNHPESDMKNFVFQADDELVWGVIQYHYETPLILEPFGWEKNILYLDHGSEVPPHLLK